MKPRFSIRYKILSMVTALLVVAIGLYLLLATRIFQQDKLELVFDLNRSFVTTLAAQVDTTLRGVADKMRLFALIHGDQQSTKTKDAFQQVLSGDPFLVRLELYEMGADKKMKLVSEVADGDYAKLYNLSPDFFSEKLTSARPIPFDDIRATSVRVWNATIEKGPALLGMGIPVVRENEKGAADKVMAVVGYVKADDFIKNLKSSTLTHAFIVGADGKVLVHSDPKIMMEAVDFSSRPIVNDLRTSRFGIGVKKYQDSDQETLGAFAKVNTGGVGIVASVEGQKVFSAVRDLFKRSLQFALIISTITFIATIFFSRSLTSPLARLMAAMEKVSSGDLDVDLKVKSHDEIALLSRSFNQMTHDLKTSREQLEEINRELENKVIDRTRKLEEQNRAVKEAQEALLRTTRLASVGEIAGRTAHEVLNPLTSLMARVQKVQKRLNEDVITHKNLLGDIVSAWKEDLQEKGVEGFLKSLQQPSSIDPKMTLLQEDLGNINEIFASWDKDLGTLETDTQFLLQQATRIDKILKQMRSLSVVGNRKTRTGLHPVLHDAVNIVADLFAKNKVDVIEDFGAATDQVKVDRDEIIQVLTNILRNSLHAVIEAKDRPGKRTVRVETKNIDGKLVVDIVDDGIGISDENRPKLFESQFSTKSPEVGTGLGLSISRRFVRAFDGDLFLLKSEVGKGSTFRIELPLIRENEQGVAA